MAGVIDQMGLVEEVDRLLGIHPQEHVTCGQVLKGLILNGLGFVSAPLYLFEQFFVGKATEHLIGPGVKPEHFNDDRLGRALDKFYQFGTTQLFVHLAQKSSKQFGVKTRSAHVDSTSMHVDGAYSPEGRVAPHPDDEPQPIRINHGYSRDHRPDLKQFLVNMICSGDGDVPLYIKVGNGNQSDKTTFPQLIQDFRAQWEMETLFVADSALYSAENLAELKGLKWLTRVPSTLGEVTHLIANLSDEQFEVAQAGYRIAEVCTTYAQVHQRWIVVESEQRQKSDLESLEKKLQTLQTKLQKEWAKLCKTEFACQTDALNAAEGFACTLDYHLLGGVKATEQVRHPKAGRPGRDSQPQKTGVWLLRAYS